MAIALLVVEIKWIFFVTWPCKTTWSRDFVILWNEALKHIAKFGGNEKYFSSSDIRFLIFHLTSSGNLFKGLYDFIGGSFS